MTTKTRERNDGTPSQDAFVRYLGTFGKDCLYYRLTDTREVKGANKSGFTKKTPSDYIVTISGMGMFYAEVKSMKLGTSFPFSCLSVMQKSYLERQVKNHAEYKIYLHDVSEDLWYEIPGRAVVEAEARGKKSLTKPELLPFKLGQIDPRKGGPSAN